MGSSMSAIYDDYHHYVSICEKLQIEPLPMRDLEGSTAKWHTHYEELLLKSES
jgi:hypothetical protein